MASENEVAVDDESVVVEISMEPKKEEQNSGNCEKMSENNDISENAAKAASLDSSATKLETPVTEDSEIKTLKPVKEQSTPVSGSAKKSKAAKEKPTVKLSGTFSRSPRPFLSQSVSFPSRGARADLAKKSVDGIPKSAVKSPRANGIKPKATSSSDGVSASTKRTNLATMPGTQTATSKSSPVNAASEPSFEVSKSENENSKPVKASLPSKDDEDARSTTTSNSTPRGRRSSTGSGFSFRLNERAEKRKEFFMKLEEKIHAKEVEKNNLQEKSKENQEAEIKKLRKTLTFKATPMPSFYKDPPPKAELKKIPTTRPKSPKLGRKKGSTEATKTSTGGEAGSCASPRLNREQTSSTKGTLAKNFIGPNKTITKTQPKVQARANATTAKTASKTVTPKLKTAELDDQTQKANKEKLEEMRNPSSDAPKTEDPVVGPEGSEENPNELEVPSCVATSNIVPSEVIAVGG